MSRACDKCGFCPPGLLRRFTVTYADGTMITLRLCPECYDWSTVTLREALFGKAGV